ncbi:MAG: GNAT family N-acetyltransferase [Pseudomonadota bacterium]|nr:GNAT family N-acetyltransferase [Pseudomonadota bacterium]
MSSKINKENPPKTFSSISSLNEVSKGEWDACAGDENPFLCHDFLSSLEDSGSVSPEAGWLSQHIICRNKEGLLIAAVPLYLKGHSYGEYIFDWSWADAWERSGNRYFPKLLSGVPFTPVTCRKLLVKQGEDLISMQQALVQALVSVTKQLDVSSLHVNFIPPEEIKPFETTDFLNRSGLQYHWLNKNYESFDDFLSELTSRKRKSIKKERKNALQNGIKISALNGNDIKSFHWDAFYDFYLDTTEKKWGGAYLNKAFFELIGERMSDKILLIIAEYNGQPVGGALNFIGKTTLFGRNWGCTADFKFLHFEACYYQAIDFAISNKIVSVEAGAQGHHKLQRGYLPTLTHSTHFISDTRFRAAVEGFLKKETQQMLFEKQELDKMSPFKK